MSGLPDLHRHLDGSLRPETLAELAAEAGREVPDDLAFTAGMGLEDALARFAFTVSLLQDLDVLERVAAEICEDAAADGVTTLEIRFAPQLHRSAGPMEAVVDAVSSGIDGRAGLILCGLYGDSPDLLDQLVTIGGSRGAVVGMDLAGGPAPFHEFDMADYVEAFSRARDLGLGRTVHAGEGRPPEEIRFAIQQLHANRIGHGTTLLDDSTVLDLVLQKGVTIEACPTSNVHTGVISTVADHPLPRWLELGVRACVNTDNTLLSAVTATEEHQRVSQIPEMTAERLSGAMANGHDAAFG